jgi:hypothetical protein
MTAGPDRIPEIALDWTRADTGAALATVIDTWGSAPRPKGAQLAVSARGYMMGSVSGGCVEGAVVAEALEVLEDGAPRILEYGVSDADAFAVGLAWRRSNSPTAGPDRRWCCFRSKAADTCRLARKSESIRCWNTCSAVRRIKTSPLPTSAGSSSGASLCETEALLAAYLRMGVQRRPFRPDGE